MKKILGSLIQNHLKTNVIFWGVILIALFTWFSISKEELPEFESNWIRITTYYPGASAEDVELFVTKPLEEEIKLVLGIESIWSTSSVGISSIRIVIDENFPEKKEVFQEIKDSLLRVQLPSRVREIPRIRQFKSTEKAILDIGLYLNGKKTLKVSDRIGLQKLALSFENQLLALPEVASIEKSHYLKPEFLVEVDSEKMRTNEVSLSEIENQIRANNLRVPVGAMRDKGESKITVLNELESIDALKSVVLRGNDTGVSIFLKDLAQVRNSFQKSNSIFKVNGHEAIFLNVRKNVTTDILSAQKAVMKRIENFKEDSRQTKTNSPLKIVLMDDESYAVTNRLNIVKMNGLVGFFLILFVLFIFFDMKTGFWVAMGIPFCAAFTLIISYLLGYSINNMTLAGVIIVLGIVVDDAIIIAENIYRHRQSGKELVSSAVEGTAEVFKPIVGSIVTTCVAFIPLLFFEGFFGKLVKVIPMVVLLMLMGSLLESLFILPSHLVGKKNSTNPLLKKEQDWFYKFELAYQKILERVLKFKIIILFSFLPLLLTATFLYKEKLRFVMFPREESKEVFVKVSTPEDFDRVQTAEAIFPLEKMLFKDVENVVGVRSTVGLSRRGGELKENEASILIELKPLDERTHSLDDLLKKWRSKVKDFPELERVTFLRGRWGHSSGTALSLEILENSDDVRSKVTRKIKTSMEMMNDITDIEVKEPLLKREYLFQIKQERLVRYKVDPSRVTSSLRSFVEGSIVYSVNKGDEERDIRLSVKERDKIDLKKLLDLRVLNRSGNLIPVKNMIEIKEVKKPLNIERSDFKRVTSLFANPVASSSTTPLEVAEKLEAGVFKEIYKKFPTTRLKWVGEVKESRKGRGRFLNSIIIVSILIYLILVFIFNSITRPLIVLSVIPFGLAGVIFVIVFHGMSLYGLFASIGALGMIGVIVNDAIVMIDRFEESKKENDFNEGKLINVASTRLRPVIVTTLTTVVGVLPTAYGLGGHDSLLAEMMLTLGWGLAFGTIVTLILIPIIYSFTLPKISKVP